MLERITALDALWNSPPFAQEGALFNVMNRLGEAQDGLFLTDRRTILMAQTAPDKSMWIWTAQDVGGQTMQAIRAACDAHEVVSITARSTLVASAFADWRIEERLVANICPALRAPARIAGVIEKPAPHDVPAIAAMMRGFDMDAFHRTDVGSAEAYLPEARGLIDGGSYTILRRADGEVLAGAKLSQLDTRYGRIGLVYTLPHARGNGYAGMVVAAIAREIIAAGRTPMLYTDGDYPSSNRAYAKVGFVPVGELLKCRRSG